MQVKWENQYVLCCNLPQYTICQILQKSVNVCKNNSEIKKVSVLLEHTCSVDFRHADNSHFQDIPQPGSVTYTVGQKARSLFLALILLDLNRLLNFSPLETAQNFQQIL